MSAAERREVIEIAASEVFAERGYPGASVAEIACRSGVTPPVLYDHFDSKRDLFRAVLERHFAELRGLWREHFVGEDPLEERIARSFEAWFAYIASHPFAGRMLFRDSTGDPQADAVHAEVAAQSRAAILPLFAADPGNENALGTDADPGLELAWVVTRGVLQGLALWWYEHPQVPRERIVQTAMNALWVGFERVVAGDIWQPLAQNGRPA